MPDIEKILSETTIAGGKMQIAQIPSEIRDFMAWLSERDIKDILEIGVGGTTVCWKGLFPDAYVLGIDIGTGSDLLFEMQKKFGFSLMMRTDSHDLRTVIKIPASDVYGQVKGKAMFDFVFVDGDHSYEGVKKDYELYWPLVRDEGLMAFHDIKDTEHHRKNNCFVGQFWGELKGRVFRDHSVKEFCDLSVDWGGIGVIFK